MYSIGKLAKISNTTIRTLRYYDEIDLLKPAEVSEGNHRYYDFGAIEKLHNIVLLKELGFELETIHSILRRNVKSSKELLQLRLELIEEELANLDQRKKKINTILQVIDMEGKNDWEIIFNTASTLRSYNHKEMAKRWNRHFTEKEQNILNELPKVGEDSPLGMEWMQLLKETKDNVHVDPASEKGQQLARRWIDIVEAMYKGNKELANKVWGISVEKNQDIGFYKFDPGIIDFIREIQTYFYKNNDVTSLNQETDDE